jgi:hypothetical protein
VVHNLLGIKNKKCIISLSVCLVLLSTVALSQKKSSYRNPEHTTEDLMGLKQGWFVGADLGTTLFYGDVSLFNSIPKYKDLGVSAGRGFSLYGGKKFKFGLSAEIQLFKGTLKGEKRADMLYPRYFRADVTSYAVNAKYNLSQLIFREQNDRKFFNRLTMYVTVGGGQVFFRSRLYKYAVNDQWYLEKVSGFASIGVDSAGVSTAGGLVTEKAKTVSAFILPIGGKINFKLNQKTDVVLDINYTTAFTDQLDSWSRSWSHKDRYLYAGIGLMYNFGNKASEDVPDSDRLLRPGAEKSDVSGAAGDAYDSSSSSSDSKPKKGRLSKKNKKEDKDLEIKMKLYELQLKLFEMQYLVE